MSRESIYMILPIVGLWIAGLLRLFIDGKCRKVLEAKGMNPNPKELEIFKGAIYPWQHLKRIREEIEIRKKIDANLGRWYARTHILSVIMIIVFICMIFLILKP